MKQIEEKKYTQAIDLIEELYRITLNEVITDDFPYKVQRDIREVIDLLDDDDEDREIFRIHHGTNEY